ncbi:DUF2231 domain-containing protein [Nodosilinea nodulosa]|uniref:DUF2231 domain-containing protein n=1 Tax=Nodosilinea nodulosa TaxID=416001 RepID=UPI0002EB201D|nr:DUF2231 domain-containing protein [Nodosilinea nodulosa]
MENIHPLFVHFPIALLLTGLLLDGLGFVLKKSALSTAGWWCFGLGVLSAVVTVFTGMQAESTVSLGPEASEVLEKHEHFQLYSTVALVGLLIWRCIRWRLVPPLASVYFVVTILAVGAIAWGSHYGGMLVYEYGVGTAVHPEQPQGDTPEQSALPPAAAPAIAG